MWTAGAACTVGQAQTLQGDFFSWSQFESAFQSMAELEAGAIANPDEQRMVGHYWLRNPELAPNPTVQKKISNSIEQVRNFALDVISGKVCHDFMLAD